MSVVKNILVKVAISLLAGAASAIGMHAGSAICNNYEIKKRKQATGRENTI